MYSISLSLNLNDKIFPIDIPTTLLIFIIFKYTYFNDSLLSLRIKFKKKSVEINAYFVNII